MLENARRITMREGLSKPLSRLCLLAALYHDISRFDQYLVYGTFRDKDSCNHGSLSVKILKAEKRLETEPKQDRHLIFTAIGLHNRFRLPPRLTAAQSMICEIVRSADKLDILRVMDEHLSGPGPYNPTVVLSLPDDPDICGQTALDAALAKTVASYNDLRSVNDFRILLGSWFFEMRASGAKELFLRAGHGRRLVEAVPDNAAYGKARNFLLECFSRAEKPRN